MIKNIYIALIVIGLIFPILSLVFDIFDSCFDFLNIDTLDFGDGFHTEFLPLSGNAICMALILFGAISLILINNPMWIRHVIAGVIAYIGAILVQSLIHYLKKQKNESEPERLILGRTCYVTNKITQNGFGAIICKKENSSDISMTAKSLDNNEILQDTKVKIVKIENGIAFVIPDFSPT